MFKKVWVLAQRDVCMAVMVNKDPITKITYCVTFSIEHEKCPARPKFVRAECILGGWIIFDNGDGTCETVYVSEIDAKGNIPQFVMILGAEL